MHEVDTGHHLEQLAGEVRGRAAAERGHADLAWIGLGVGNELGDGFRRDRWVRNHHHGIIDESRYGCDIALQVEGEAFIHASVDYGGRTEKQQRAPIGRRACTAMLVPAPGRFSLLIARAAGVVTTMMMSTFSRTISAANS